MISILIFLIFFSQKSSNGNFIISKFKADLEAGYVCPDNDELEVPIRFFQIDRFNRTHRAISVDFTFAHPIDESCEGAFFIERFIDGGWKPMPSLTWQKDPCNSIGMKYGKENLIRLGKALRWKNPGKCPIPAGNYSMMKHPFITHHDTPFWPGKFKVRMVLRKIVTKQKIMCTITIMNIEEIVN